MRGAHVHAVVVGKQQHGAPAVQKLGRSLDCDLRDLIERRRVGERAADLGEPAQPLQLGLEDAADARGQKDLPM